jgi:hypothetical protein
MTALKPIPWTLVDGLLSMRMNGSTINLSEDHPNFDTLVGYLVGRKWRVVEALVYRLEKRETLVEKMSHYDARKDVGNLEVASTRFAEGLPILTLARPDTEPAVGRIATVILDPIEDQDEVILRLWTLALRVNKDTFAYQSSEEKFPGDLKVTPAGDVFEYRAKEENWVPLLKIQSA